MIHPEIPIRGYPTILRRLEVAGHRYDLLGPGNYESLIDTPQVQARFEKDEYMPYWAEFWPACLLLADAVAAWGPAPAVSPPRVLELGCGLGLVSLVAMRHGYRAIASDYDEDALAFVAESAKRSGVPTPELRQIDWREMHPDLVVERIVAAEVLYETRSLRPIAEFIRNHLSLEGFALISDANRSTAEAFDSIARHCGLRLELQPAERAAAGGGPVRGRIFTVRHKE